MNMSHFYITIIAALLSAVTVSEQHGLESSCMFGEDSNCFISSQGVMCWDERQAWTVSPSRDCRQLDCECSTGNNSKSPLNMTMTDKTVGSLTVSFEVVDDIIHKEQIEVVLTVNNKLNKKECQKTGNHFQDLMRKRLRLKKCDLSSDVNSCDEAVDTVFVNFTNLHSACYQVEVRHEASSFDGKSIVSCPKYLTTGHAQPIDVRDFDQPKVVCQFLEEGALNINVRPFINGSTDSNQFFTTIVDENNDTSLFFPNESNFKVLEDGILSYQYNSLKPGNYCHGIRYMDSRCLLSNRCDCIWRHRIMVFESTPKIVPKDEIKDNQSEIPLLITIGVLTLSGLLLATTFFVLYLMKIPSEIINATSFNWENASDTIIPTIYSLDKQESLTLLHLKARKKIFLLYARDCKLFMEAMEKLRMVLSLNGCEVFDVWDPHLIETIRSDPMIFVQSQIVDETTTTIVVASECSKLICDNYRETVSVDYKEPQEFDHLFRFGRKVIVDNFQKKCFVVKLASQTPHEPSDDIQLAGIDNLENYILPLHLEQLILNIHRVGGIVVEQDQLNGASEISQFNTLVNELSEYKLQNPDYLLNEFISITPGNNS